MAGPIIMVQVENEYGSFGSDHAYMEQIHQDIVDAGFSKSLIYTADGPEQIPNGSLPGLPAGINFAPGNAPKAFATLHKLRPEGPFMATEWWDGWFDHWGGEHHTSDPKAQADELQWILTQGYSISIYMVHGGTSFGWMNGASVNQTPYQPDVTSYDYDSAIDESGRPGTKYFPFRDAIAKATGVTPPPVPVVDPPIATPPVEFKESASLWQTLPQPFASEQVVSMEDLNQAYGYILYRTTVPGPVAGDLVLDELHDYAQIYANGKLLGTLDRRLEQNHLHVDLKEPKTQLDILVENTGRVNFGVEMRGERSWNYEAGDAERQAADGLADLFAAHERSGEAAVPHRRLHGRVLLSRSVADRPPRRHVSRHEQFREGNGVGERPCAGAGVEYRAAEDALSAGSVAASGSERSHCLRSRRRAGPNRRGKDQADSECARLPPAVTGKVGINHTSACRIRQVKL